MPSIAPFADELPDALLVLEPEGLVVAWSRGAERMLGVPESEAIGRSLLDLVPPVDSHPEREAWAAALTGRTCIYEVTRRRRDGTTIVIDATVRAIPRPGGGPPLLAVCKKDVTRLKLLREADILDARYRGLLEAAPDAMVIVDRDGRMVLVNSQTQRLFGYARGELIGEPVELLIPERFRARHPAHRASYLREPRPRPMGASLDLAGLRKDRSEFPAEISLSPIAQDGGGLLVTAAIRDVTMRRRIEARFRGLLEAAPDAMVIVRADGTIALVNGQTERLFGYDRAELVGQLVEVLVPEPLRPGHPAQRTRYFDDPRPRAMSAGVELAGRRKDGSRFPAEISLSPLETEEGTLVSAAIRDVTQRKELERRKAEALAEESRRIAEASRLKSEFLANMSHELRTPLNGIIGFAKLMHSGLVGELAPSHREYMGDILSSAQHLLRLINDVLDLSKVEAGKMELDVAPVDLVALARDACASLAPLADQKGIRLSHEVAPDAAVIESDAARVTQVLLNFLSNALKFTPDGGRVQVRIRGADARHVRLEVEDDGPGISARDQERLFVEFQQLDASAAKRHQGTGLGLALSRRVARLLGGDVGVHSAPGAGSTFFALLPRRSAAAGHAGGTT